MSSRIPTCHPDRSHEAKGLCKACYDIGGRERRKEYARSNRAKISAVRRLHYLKNKERISRQVAAYKKANKDKFKSIAKARCAKQRGADVCDFTHKQWAAMKLRFHNTCFYCGVIPESLEQDHVIPLSKGGNHTENNIVPCCRTCNASKQSKALEEFLCGRMYQINYNGISGELCL